MKKNDIFPLASSNMSVVSLESPEGAGACGQGLSGLPGDCATGLVGVLGAEELLEAMGVCNSNMQKIVGLKTALCVELCSVLL